MMKKKINHSKARIRKWIRKTYDKISLLSDEQITSASLKRKEFYDFFSKNKVKYACGSVLKPYINELAPGCLPCINGTWSCVHINSSCTRNCFFCVQDKNLDLDKSMVSDRITFSSVDEYIEHLKSFNFEGVGFSGGEPFLAFDKMLEIIEKIRGVFGQKHHVWMNTNGDAITEEKLVLLKKAGLNEIRFNLSARGYDLKPLKLALKYIDIVAIEIPLIPEDLDFLKQNLKKFLGLGVKYLNVHQLLMNKNNYKFCAKRGYTLMCTDLNSELFPILESEMAAFDLLKYAINNKIKIGINYCSGCYKNVFQSKGFRLRYADLCRNQQESLTKIGYIRRFEIKGSEFELNKLLSLLIRKGVSKNALKIKDKSLILSQEALKILAELDSLDNPINVIYSAPIVIQKPRKQNSGYDRKKTDNKQKLLKKIKVKQIRLSNEMALLFFIKLFLENKKFHQVKKEILTVYDLSYDDLLEDIKRFRSGFENIEYLQENLPDYW